MDIGIDENARRQVADGLGHLLADTWVLYLKTHAFHWNVTGRMFQTLHVLFEEQYRELWASIDEIAERIRTLGRPAPGTWSEFADLASIRETPGVPDALEMVRLLVEGHEAVARTARKLLPQAQEAGDEATVDLLVGRLSVHEKTAWMLRSMLEG